MQSSAYPPPGGPQHAPRAGDHSGRKRPRRTTAVRHRRLRLACGSVLTALTIILAPLGLVAVWVDSVITDTDRYVATVAPIAREPAVQNELTDRLTEWVAESIDNEEVTSALAATLQRNGAPPSVVEQAGALSDGEKTRIAEVVRDVVERAVTTDQFAGVWEDANRRAHTAVVRALTGEGGSAVEIRGDAVTLDVGTLLDAAEEQLADAGFEVPRTTDVDKSIVLVRTDELDEAQRLMRVLDEVGGRLPALVVALAALAIWITPARRVALMVMGTGVGLMMAALLVALALLRRAYLHSVPAGSQTQRAAAVFHDSLFHSLQTGTRAVLVVSAVLVAACCAWGAARVAGAAACLPRGPEAVARVCPPMVRACGPAAIGVAVTALALTGLLAVTRTAPAPVPAEAAHLRHPTGPPGPAAGSPGTGRPDLGRGRDGAAVPGPDS